MNKIFLDYNTCKKLKKIKFNESCLGYYHNNVVNPEVNLFTNGLNMLHPNVKNITLACTYEQCLNWLRTKYFINIKIEYLCSLNEILALVGVIDFMINKFEKPDIYINSNSLDYYEVLTETINETLNIIEKW